MKKCQTRRFDRFLFAAGLGLAALILLPIHAEAKIVARIAPVELAQAAQPATPEPAPVQKAAPAPSPAPAAPDMGDEAEPKSAPGISEDAGITPVEVPARPVALIHDGADWDNGFKTIAADFKKIEAEIAKAGLTQAGHPFAVFTETDDNGFKFDAMIPLKEKPEGKEALGDGVSLGTSPSGKAIKFEHRDSYDSIDSTYDLITAYLDEKGLEAKNLFIEEYLTDLKNSDDESLEVDIYVFIK